MEYGSLLNYLIFLPAMGGVLCLFAPSNKACKSIGIAITALTFALSLLLFQHFAWWQGPVFGEGYGQGIYEITRLTWITLADAKIEYYVGVDGLSFPLVILTTFITFLAAIASWNFEHWKVSRGIRGYFCLLLLLETGMIGTFVSLDFFLFYIFWEVMLLPMYFLIGVWGGPRKEYAAIKFFIYTLAGSVLMLVALVAFYFYAPEGHKTFDLIRLATDQKIRDAFADPNTTFIRGSWQFGHVMFLFLFIAFAIKVPIFPFHTWLPDAHVEAPTPISMILAGVLLKMGAYGLFRIAYPILPQSAHFMAYGLALLGVINIIYGALCAMAQTDFKRLVAYSSVSHMGYVLLGIAIMTTAGWQGAMFQVIAHGISSPMCFFLVGIIYDRAHHREINRFGGLWLTMPVYGSLATLGFFASLGLPGLCGFIGEFWVLIATFGAPFSWAKPMAVVAAFGVVLTAGYILWMIQRVYLGKPREEYHDFEEASGREIFILTPLAILCIALGILPMQTMLNFTTGTLSHLTAQFTQLFASHAGTMQGLASMMGK